MKKQTRSEECAFESRRLVRGRLVHLGYSIPSFGDLARLANIFFPVRPVLDGSKDKGTGNKYGSACYVKERVHIDAFGILSAIDCARCISHLYILRAQICVCQLIDWELFSVAVGLVLSQCLGYVNSQIKPFHMRTVGTLLLLLNVPADTRRLSVQPEF